MLRFQTGRIVRKERVRKVETIALKKTELQTGMTISIPWRERIKSNSRAQKKGRVEARGRRGGERDSRRGERSQRRGRRGKGRGRGRKGPLHKGDRRSPKELLGDS